MIDEPKIIIKIDKEGDFIVEVNGVKGHGCRAMTEALEKSLGFSKEQQLTGEYFEKAEDVRLKTGYS